MLPHRGQNKIHDTNQPSEQYRVLVWGCTGASRTWVDVEEQHRRRLGDIHGMQKVFCFALQQGLHAGLDRRIKLAVYVRDSNAGAKLDDAAPCPHPDLETLKNP